MVAYSFKRRFVTPIREGWKCGTIRAHGKRHHARPGQALQLYCEMRRPTCFKILEEDPICERVNEIEFVVRMFGRSTLWSNGVRLYRKKDLAEFARADGFETWDHMVAFWNETHGAGIFRGVHIIWPRPPAREPSSQPTSSGSN